MGLCHGEGAGAGWKRRARGEASSWRGKTTSPPQLSYYYYYFPPHMNDRKNDGVLAYVITRV